MIIDTFVRLWNPSMTVGVPYSIEVWFYHPRLRAGQIVPATCSCTNRNPEIMRKAKQESTIENSVILIRMHILYGRTNKC